MEVRAEELNGMAPTRHGKNATSMMQLKQALTLFITITDLITRVFLKNERFTAFALQFRCKLRLSCYYVNLNSKPANRFPAQPKVLAPIINLEPPQDGIVHISYQATSTVCKMLLSFVRYRT